MDLPDLAIRKVAEFASVGDLSLQTLVALAGINRSWRSIIRTLDPQSLSFNSKARFSKRVSLAGRNAFFLSAAQLFAGISSIELLGEAVTDAVLLEVARRSECRLTTLHVEVCTSFMVMTTRTCVSKAHRQSDVLSACLCHFILVCGRDERCPYSMRHVSICLLFGYIPLWSCDTPVRPSIDSSKLECQFILLTYSEVLSLLLEMHSNDSLLCVLQGTNSLSDTSLIAIALMCPGLKHLHLKDLGNVRGAFLPALLKCCTSLESLSLHGLPKFIWEFAGLCYDQADSLPSLQHLTLVNCHLEAASPSLFARFSSVQVLSCSSAASAVWAAARHW